MSSEDLHKSIMHRFTLFTYSGITSYVHFIYWVGINQGGWEETQAERERDQVNEYENAIKQCQCAQLINL